MSKMMLFPKKVSIFNDAHAILHFGPGLVEVPDDLVDHWYFKANGVKSADEAKAETVKTTDTAAATAKAVAAKAKGETAKAVESAKE